MGQVLQRHRSRATGGRERETNMSKLGFMVGFGAGYVLGSKAGHERYEQLRRLYDNLLSSPQLKRATGKARDAVETGYEQARDKASEGVNKVQEKVRDRRTDDRSGLSVAPPPSSN
jgi:hypothetical protein